MNGPMPSSVGIRIARPALALWLAGTAMTAPADDTASDPLLPPVPQSPVAQFRLWLDLSESDRSQALSDKPEPMRTILMAKLAEYDVMDPTRRDLRLRATELQYYLRPLLRLSATERAASLKHVPSEFRPLIDDRLSQWDAIDAETREELTQNAWAIRYFVRLEASTEAEQAALRGELPPERRAQFETELARWKSLPANQRHEITRAFHRFFELPTEEQQRALENLPESERRQIEATLRAFGQLAPAQRQVCLDSFRKFAGFTPNERADFLRNVDRWKEMSPEDRATWRRLVTQLPPLPQPPLPLPPSPIGATEPTP
jgi:hypothetical protein